MLEQAIEKLTVEVRNFREVMEQQNILLKTGRVKPASSKPERKVQTASPVTPEKAPDGLLNEREVSKLVGLSLGTVRRWRLFRTGPPYRKLGSAVRYSRAEVLAWLDGQRAQ